MFGVAVAGVGGRQDVRLLGAGGHAGGGAAALDVEDHRRNLGEIGKAHELLHQADAGTRGAGEGPGAVPPCPDHDTDGGDLVLGLHDGEAVLLRGRIDAELLTVVGEGFGQRGGRRDRVPGADRGPAIDGAQGGGVIALDIDPVAHLVGPAHLQADGLEDLGRFVAAHVQRLEVRWDQAFLGRERLADQGLEDLDLHPQQVGERADIDDVLEQLPLPGVPVSGVGYRRKRYSQNIDILAELVRRQGLGGVIEQIAARLDGGDVRIPGLGVHGHHQVDAAAPAEVPRLADPHLKPGGQALDVGGEDVPGGDRHAHADHRLGEHAVGAGRAGAVDVGELDHEVVDGAKGGHSAAIRVWPGPAWVGQAPSAWVMSSRNFCISHAPVGQRSAQSPQCRQTSSSFTITLPVGRVLET